MTRNDTAMLDAIAYARTSETPVEVVRAWHDEHHTDPFIYCMTEPCATIHREIERARSLAPAGGHDADAVATEVRAWHDREHDEPHAFCQDTLCFAMRMFTFIRPEAQGTLL